MDGKSFWGLSGDSPMNSALTMLAVFLALGSAIVISPEIYRWTIDMVLIWIADRLGEEYQGFGSYVYGALIFGISFSLMRMVLILLILGLVSATVMLSYRFLPLMAM